MAKGLSLFSSDSSFNTRTYEDLQGLQKTMRRTTRMMRTARTERTRGGYEDDKDMMED